MDINKKQVIQEIVDEHINNFAINFAERYRGELNKPKGVINYKKLNCFISELGGEFVFYSALVRSFDSSFGNILESMGNAIAKVSYEVKGDIDSFILPEQLQQISTIVSHYENHEQPKVEHYSLYNPMIPKNIESFKKIHKTDNYFYSPEKHEHYLIELKAGGDLDNKKSKAEKIALLEEYYLLKNKLLSDETTKNDRVFIYFATAYNKDGEGNFWKQERVRQFFSDDELKIGKDYWNFVCDDEMGFEVVFEQYQKSCCIIREKLNYIKNLYFPGDEND